MIGKLLQLPALVSARDWYNSLQSREKQLVTVAASVLIVLMLYLLIWSPLVGGLHAGRLGLKTAQSNLAWMKQAQKKVQALKATSGNSTKTLGGKSILSVVESTRGANQIPAFKRIEPEGNNGVRVWVDNAPFDKLILWIGRLERRYGVSVSDIIVDKQKEPGMVNVKLIMAGQPS